MNTLELYFSPTGRVLRRTYWLKMLLPLGAIGCLLILMEPHFELGKLVRRCYDLLVIWPVLAVTIKRWHDRDKAGWWVLIALIPLVGGAWTLIECGFLPGTPGRNRFGPDPRGRTEHVAPPNGGPAERLGDSRVRGGPPSVS